MTDSGLSRSASAFGPFHDVAFLRLLFLFESSCIIVFIEAERDKSCSSNFHPTRFIVIICLPDTTNYL